MNHKVLARKWRPHRLETLVGQHHAVQALSNALNSQRLHHAYLFTGTRGVGKTTIARIIAKCLNCEKGVSANPCDQCDACLEIDSGRFFDLIEIDAASRTKVEDTRDLLDNVQYAPTKGRYKIYLIDEVHMLSGHSFNALLKTLEEPPEHVIFLLATTDPQKLPATVLSRCLQFHLKNLTIEQISQHLAYVLGEEKIPFEEPALTRLAQSANGSMRDGLSLLDQAIAHSNSSINLSAVSEMLGCIDSSQLYPLINALVDKNADNLFAAIQTMDEHGADYNAALEEVISILHLIALFQAVPQLKITYSAHTDFAKTLSASLNAQDVQLYYQIGLIGRRDLPLAPTPRMGFEMLMLRMLAFTPESISTALPLAAANTQKPAAITPSNIWEDIVKALNLSGPSAAIVQHCALLEKKENHMILELNAAHAPLLSDAHKQKIQEALSLYFNNSIQLSIKVGEKPTDSPAAKATQRKTAQKAAAIQRIETDPNIQAIIDTFNAKIIPDSVDVVDE